MKMEEKLDEINETEIIVLQAFTRDLENNSVDDMNNGIEHVINKALTKTKKLVVSTIIAREDQDNLKTKINLINANLMHTYMEDERIYICDNSNLGDGKFRWKDGIHLTQHGTSLLATNFKYKIAEALNINVVKKRRDRPMYRDNVFSNRWLALPYSATVSRYLYSINI